jgi:hypothetical protein
VSIPVFLQGADQPGDRGIGNWESLTFGASAASRHRIAVTEASTAFNRLRQGLPEMA